MFKCPSCDESFSSETVFFIHSCQRAPGVECASCHTMIEGELEILITIWDYQGKLPPFPHHFACWRAAHPNMRPIPMRPPSYRLLEANAPEYLPFFISQLNEL